MAFSRRFISIFSLCGFDGNALFPDIGEDIFKLGLGAVVYMVGFLSTIGEKKHQVVLVC
jgi:hypothetical protein